MLDKLRAVEEKFQELESIISDPAVMGDMAKWQTYTKEHAQLLPIVEKYRSYKKVIERLEEARAMLVEKDEEMRALASEEVQDLMPKKAALEEELLLLLLPRDPHDEKNVIVEIRGGVGGDEAALFAGDLFRMYTRYAERQHWKTELLSANATGIGGFKEVTFLVAGDGAYLKLKYESGTHRVQRIPVTESGGRVHTSAVTVAVLPEAEEVEVTIDPNDLRIDTYCASGAGGQYVNRTDSAVRITHIPTGIVVSCQNERSQHMNRQVAMHVLRSKLYERALQERQDELASVVGDKKESTWGSQIRSYVFQPYTMVKDMRTGMETGNVQAVMDGDLDAFIEAFLAAKANHEI